ncbi:MAG TPA: hypothetical protein VF614_09680 [Chthoniobacteraceae bacterium]
MPQPKSDEEQLQLLQQHDPTKLWDSLDDERRCILCDRVFTGREVNLRIRRTGVKLFCPSEDCHSTPTAWVHPGNPLISDEAWQDWDRVIRASESAGPSELAAG